MTIIKGWLTISSYFGKSDQEITNELLDIEGEIQLSSEETKELSRILLNDRRLLKKSAPRMLDLLSLGGRLAVEKIMADDEVLAKVSDATLGLIAHRYGVWAWERIKEVHGYNLDGLSLCLAAEEQEEIALDIIKHNDNVRKIAANILISCFYKHEKAALILVNNPIFITNAKLDTIKKIALLHPSSAFQLHTNINEIPQIHEFSDETRQELREKYSFWQQGNRSVVEEITPFDLYNVPIIEGQAYYHWATYTPPNRDEFIGPTFGAMRQLITSLQTQQNNNLPNIRRASFFPQQPSNTTGISERDLVTVKEFLKAELLASHGLFNEKLKELSNDDQLSIVQYLIAKHSGENYQYNECTEGMINKMDDYKIMLSISDAIKRVTKKDGVTQEQILQVRESYLGNLKEYERELLEIMKTSSCAPI